MKDLKVRIENISKVYENGDGIRNIDLEIHAGEIMTLLGPSGCGKSTILRCLGGFQEPDGGNIYIDGVDVTDAPAEKRPTSMVFQSYNLWGHMTVFENLAFGLKLRKVPKSLIKEKVAVMLELLKLPGIEKKYPGQLSGGQQQRIAIGRSLLLEPAVLLLDEPYSALDAKIRQQMREELKRIQRETGVTVVFVTHDQEEAMSLSDRIVVMQKGQIAQIGTPSEIYDNPVNHYTASFIGEMNFLPIENHQELAFRPEDVIVSSHTGDHQGEIKQVTNAGHYSVAMLSHKNQSIKIYLSKEEAQAYKSNQSIYFTIKKIQNLPGGKKNMKKVIRKKRSYLAMLLTAGSVLAACGNGQAADTEITSEAEPSTVTLWANGSDNVKVGMEKVVEAFNESEAGEQYELELEFILSGTGSQSLKDRIVAAEKTDQVDTDYDLILVSDAEYATYVQEGGEEIFTAYEEENVPNLANVQTEVSDGEGILVPYRGTTVVLAYNSENVETPPTTADELYEWIEANPGRFAYNTPGSGGAGGSFVQTAIYNFLPEEALTSSDETWSSQWDEGFALLAELNDSMYQTGGKVVYPNKNQGTLDLLVNQEVDMIPAWADMLITNLSNGTLPETIKMAQITPGFTGNVDAMAIPTIGSNPEGAQAVMNFMLTEEAQQILLDNMAAIPVIDSESITSDNSKYLEDLNVESFRTSSIGSLGATFNERWDQEIGTLAQ